MSADAFAFGNSVAFRTSPDLHTAAHEAAHVVQQRQGVSRSGGVGAAGDEYEQQADAVADEVVQGRSAVPLLGRRPAAPSLRPTGVQRKEQLVDARTYLLVNLQRGNSLTPYIIGTLRRLPLALPSPFATWRQGPADFLYKVARQIEIETGSVESLIRKLDVLLLPTRLDHLVDQSRALDRGKDGDKGNARGSSRVFADVGIRIANALHRTVHTALPRVLERYLEARCGPGEEPLEDTFATGSRWREPHAFMIPASHPIDPFISAALCDDSVVVKGEEYRAASGFDGSQGQGSAAQENATGKVEWRFLDDHAAPNWIKVTSPESVTIEQVSEALFGTPKAATAITAAHPYYGLELADARTVRKRHGLPTAPAKNVDPMDFVSERREDVAGRMQNMRDPAFGLANSAHADDAALAQAGQLGAASADRGALMKTLERSQIALTTVIDTANRFGLGKDLAAVEAQIEGRLQRFSGAPDSDVAKWQLHATKQHDVLFGVSQGLSQVAGQLDAMGVKGQATPAEIPDVVWQPLYHVVRLFVDTAAISHLVGIAFERLAAAETALRLAPLETLDLILDDVRDKIEATRQTGKEISTAGAGKYKRFDAGDAAREESELREQVAVVRAKMLDEDPEAGALISELYARVSKMQTESDLAYNYAVLAQLSSVFHELKTSSWSVAAFQDDDAERYSDEAFDYAYAFQRAYGHFINGDEAEAKDVVEKLRNNDKFKTFLERAHSEIEDIQTKTKIVQIATIVGIVLVSMVTGPVAGGLARRAGAGMVGQFIAASATEALTYSALDAAVFGNDSVAAMFLSEFGVNLATFGLLRAWKASKLGKHADDALAATKLDSATRMDKLKGYAFKGADLTAQGMLIAAAGFAQMQYDAYRQTGRYVSVEEMFQLGREGLAMVVAAAIGGKVLQRRLDALEDLIAGPAGKQLAADYEQLGRMAKAVEQSRDPQAALDLVRADRRLMEAELRALEQAGAPAGKRARARRASELRDQAAQLDIAELSLSLEEVVPGRQFMGTPEELAPFLDRLRSQGAEVQRQTTGTGEVRYVVTHGDRRITLHEARHYTTSGRGSGRTKDPAGGGGTDKGVILGQDLHEVMDWLKPEPGSLDVIVHGGVDNFIVKRGETEIAVDHRQLATYIRKHRREFKRIRLISCDAGKHPKGAAQHLANKLGVEVKAATDKVFVHEDGTMDIGPKSGRNTGRWVTYSPKKSGRRYAPVKDPEQPTLRERLENNKRTLPAKNGNLPAPLSRGQHRDHGPTEALGGHALAANAERLGLALDELESLAPGVYRGAGGHADSVEVALAQRVHNLRGEDVLLAPKKNQPGVDGLLKDSGRPIQVKKLRGSPTQQPVKVVRRVNEAFDAATANGWANVEVHILAPDATIAEVERRWLAKGAVPAPRSGMASALHSVTVYAADGIVELPI